MSPEVPFPDPDPEWKRRFDAKMADLEAWRAERHAERDTPPETEERP